MIYQIHFRDGGGGAYSIYAESDEGPIVDPHGFGRVGDALVSMQDVLYIRPSVLKVAEVG